MLPADAGGVLTALNVDDETVKQIVAILEANAEELHGNQPGTLTAAYLGGSDAAADLAHHTSLAHQHVVKAMEDMVAGLRGYTQNIERFHQDISFADELSSDTTAKTTGKVDVTPVPTIEQSTACTSAPDVTTNSTCTVDAGGA